ncbi:hypothetical protein JCM10213_003805 [Rhodosporidiobolus nylandii]
MLRLASSSVSPAAWAASSARYSLLRSPVLSVAAAAARTPSCAGFHSSRLLQLDTERGQHGASSPPPGQLSQEARRRVAPQGRDTSTPSASSSPSSAPQFKPVQPSPAPSNPLSPPPVEARVPKHRITRIDELPKSFGKNQIIDVPAEVQKDLEDVLRQFNAPVRYAFAYGSGVFRQKGYSSADKPLLDFIFAVSHPSHWHAINMQQHPEHYSLPMRLLGSNAVSWMQEKGLGAEVWFNVDVDVNGKTVKYGVISVDALCRDMLDWETLYISGRTQKPVRILQDDARVRLANQVNLASALRTALLLLPESFTETELFEEIAGLSYRGDFRMRVGENPHKVRNIVAAQLPAFRGLYGGLLKSFWKSVHTIGEVHDPTLGEDGAGVRLMMQDKSTAAKARTASRLPVGLREKVLAHYERKWNLENAVLKAKDEKAKVEGAVDLDKSRMWERIVSDEEFKDVMNSALSLIVARPTFNQSLKGILSAGPVKSLKYVIPKLKKKWGASASSSPPAKAVAAPEAMEEKAEEVVKKVVAEKKEEQQR